MVAIDHDVITDPEIHKSKGLVSASENSVYIADGLGSGSWQILSNADPSVVKAPIGSISFFAGTSPPTSTKWKICDGSAVSRTTYSALFAALSTVYGTGDGSTTFNLPNVGTRVIAGKDNMGTISADRLTNQTGGLNGDTLGAAGGEATTTLLTTHIPELTGSAASTGAHTHAIDIGTTAIRDAGNNAGAYSSPNGTVDLGDLITSTDGDHSHTVTVNSGGGGTHENRQPTMYLYAMIYHGVA